MALVLADRVKETTTTTGTATYTLAGASTGFESFASIGDGNTTYYACTDGTDFEVGIGTYTASGTTLARTTILQSSNSDSAVSWSSGTKTIFCCQPAEKAVFRDASGHIIALDGRNLTNVDAATLDSLDSTQFLRSDAADTKTSGDLTFSDNVKAVFGTGSDLEIFHDGANSIIKDSGTGVLQLRASDAVNIKDAANTKISAIFKPDLGVSFRYDNVKKLETTSTGATVTGTLEASGQIHFGGDDHGELAQIDNTAPPVFSPQFNGHIVLKNVSGTTENEMYLLDTKAGVDSEIFGLVDFQVSTSTRNPIFAVTGNSALKLMHPNTTNFDVTISPTTPTADRTITLPDATGTVLLNTGDQSITGDLTITSTDAGATTDPSLVLFRDSASPTAGDSLGSLGFNGNSSTDTERQYAFTRGSILGETDGNEYGQLRMGVIKAGTITNAINIHGTSNEVRFQNFQVRLDTGINLIFEGATSNANETTLTVIDPTADRTISLPDATGTVLLDTGNQSITGDLTLTSLDGGDTEDPTLKLFRNSASPADNDIIGEIAFVGKNDAAEDVTYSRIFTSITDVSDGTEDMRLEFKGLSSGVETTYLQMKSGKSAFFRDVEIGTGRNLIFEGSTGDNNETTLTVIDPTSDNTIQLPDKSGTVAMTSDATSKAIAFSLVFG